MKFNSVIASAVEVCHLACLSHWLSDCYKVNFWQVTSLGKEHWKPHKPGSNIKLSHFVNRLFLKNCKVQNHQCII